VRIEFGNLKLQGRKLEGTIEDALREVRSLVANTAVADLARYEGGEGATARVLDFALRHGISARAATLADLTRVIKRKDFTSPRRPTVRAAWPERYGLQGVLFKLLRESGSSVEDAFRDSLLVHSFALAQVRELAARTPWSFATMFDLAVTTQIEPLLRALVGDAAAPESRGT
jgi:hypothetical protein